MKPFTNESETKLDTREKKRTAHFSQKPMDVTFSFNSDEKSHDSQHLTKGKLTCIARGLPSKTHSCTSDSMFDIIYLHLVLSGCLSLQDLSNLNQRNMIYGNLCKIIKSIKL